MSELAKEEGITRARMTQIMNLLKLAPEIREYIRNLNDPEEIDYFTERRLRKISSEAEPEIQVKRFEQLRKAYRNIT